MADYPIQISKVQAPPLREETLARERLLEWLSVKIHRRVVLLTAEAGYGKTTLLADFSRRTRLRVFWYRLDRGDRDWVGFLAYLVAAIRIHVPDFGEATSALLRETATASPALETVLDTFLRELSGLPNDPTVFVFDDVHLVDDAPEVRHVLRELLARAPERMSFVFASRREPPIRLARLRALGEVAELGTDDLRFDAIETERLFRDTYEMRLEPGVLVELRRRTEGWAASLQLVRAALHDRDPGEVRSFISSLSGAEGHLYEYLAEEVVGELPADLQQFLMRTSLLDTIDLTLGPVAADVDEPTARSLIEAGERNGLFTRGGPGARYVVRAHPLVRDFLKSRLARAYGADGVQTIHLRIAKEAEIGDWRIAARHYAAAARDDDARRVLTAALDLILATGAYAAADELSSSFSTGPIGGAAGLVIRSRLAQQRSDSALGLDLAERAWPMDPESTAVLLNLVSARTLAGDIAGALEAGRLLERSSNADLAAVGRVYQRLQETSVGGSLSVAIRELEELADTFRRRGDARFLGVALLNLSHAKSAAAAPDDALRLADEAILLLSNSSAKLELVSAKLARATALAQLGDMDSSRASIEDAASEAAPGQSIELAIEIGQIEALYGESSRAAPYLERVSAEIAPSTDNGEQAVLARLYVAIGEGDIDSALRDAVRLEKGGPRFSIAFEARRHLARGLAFSLASEPDAPAEIDLGARLARSQHAETWAKYGALLSALSSVPGDPSPAIAHAGREFPMVLSMLAEAVVRRLKDLDDEAKDAVRSEAERRPWRWRKPTRALLGSRDHDDRIAAASLLEAIGDATDVRRLRDVTSSLRGRGRRRFGQQLARRLAHRVFVEDLGRVHIRAGTRTIEGSDVRRKVLALLCLLVSKSRFAATRDEVVDALWPELDPQSALNSLNQTVYFLRRVFEPEYEEDISPGYVGQDGETIWLDPELIDSRSRGCLELIRSTPSDPSPEQSLALANQYRGRFALDFAYEDWAAVYRDALHAGYLRVVEHAIRMDLDSGHFGRGTYLAERALEVDQEAEGIQIALVRLYRLSGAHAAAAEQYGHYERSMRQLGLEPAPFAELAGLALRG